MGISREKQQFTWSHEAKNTLFPLGLSQIWVTTDIIHILGFLVLH